MAGLVIFTGANGSMGLYAADYLLSKYPHHTAIFTVRDASESDENTRALRDIIAKHAKGNAFVLPLDLADLTATHAFADKVIAGMQSGAYPSLDAIVCNAYYWNLVGDPEQTVDGFDKTIQIAHIAHAALVLRLLGSFGDDGGRIVLLSSDSHWPGKNPMEVFPPSIDDLDELIKPQPGGDKQGLGYQRYASSKLAMTAWMYALNRQLQQNGRLGKITAVAINPGGMIDSRCLRTNTPESLAQLQQSLLATPLTDLQRQMGPTVRTAEPASADVVELALNPAYRGKCGFYTLLREDKSSPDSQNEEKQIKLWDKTLEWARITETNTALPLQHGLD